MPATNEERIQAALDRMRVWLPVGMNGQSHPVLQWIAQDRAENQFDNFTVLGIESLAEMTTTLDSVNPTIVGIASMRRRFRDARDEADLWNVRLELAVAWMLVKAGIRFRFGAPPNPEPDFVLEDFGIGIEVTRRDYDGVDDLVQDLTRLIGTRSLTLTLTFDNYPLQVRKATKNSIMLRVSQAIETGSQIDTIHEIDTFTGTFALAIEIAQKPDDNDASHVKVEVESAALARTMEHVEEALLAKTRDQQKIEQARSMPTILLIESSDVGYAYMRSAATWEAVLRTWMSAELPFLGVGLVQRNVLAPGMGFTIVLNPHADEMVLERASNVLALIAAVFPA